MTETVNMFPSNIKALILDMDGVIWKADAPIGDLAATFQRIRERGLKYVFATNNSTKTSEQYVDRLNAFGVEAEPWQVITSSQAAARAIAQTFPPGTKILVIGEDGLRIPIEREGLKMVSLEDASRAQVVVMGMDRGVTFEKLSEATLLIRRGIPFYATNTDKTFPTPRGQIPGAGAWISVITTATNVEPIVTGKPFPSLMELSLDKLGTKREETLVVGDRLETDIAAGQAVGCPTALVLSGVSTQEQAANWNPAPDLIVSDLSELIE
jgi:4-nitrophenyl phosphatase